uniref:Uncharacterized protein n=1 Tax=Gadus morhua TaxID=8049 RepID=A0A8C5A1V2_GADMO
MLLLCRHCRVEPEVTKADQIYLLMKEEYRISRNVRLAWFSWQTKPKHLLQLHSENELDLLSVLPQKDGSQSQPPTARPCMLIPSTRAIPSTGIVDDSAGKLIFDEVFNALFKMSRWSCSTLPKFLATSQVFQPKVFITILAYSSIIGLSSHQGESFLFFCVYDYYE